MWSFNVFFLTFSEWLYNFLNYAIFKEVWYVEQFAIFRETNYFLATLSRYWVTEIF